MNAKKLSGLFINCVEAQDSIFESGRMVFECLLNSDKYSLDYIEITPDRLEIRTDYDFYLFNYHVLTMPWLDTKAIKTTLPGIKMTMVLEVSPNDPFVLCSPDDFDVYCVLDPTLNINQKNVFAFPRPLEVYSENITSETNNVPVIGSFGFATKGKGFDHLIDAVNREFERAIVRINIPFATYADESQNYARQLGQMCKDKAKDGIEVIVTHDFMSKSELIKWCSQNTLNCFLYDRNMPGLAATTDQAISSGRPLSISKNSTFRHIQKYIKPFPYQTLKEAIENTPKKVEEIQREWSPEKFRTRFEQVLAEFDFDNRLSGNSNTVKLRLMTEKKNNDFLVKLKSKIAVRTRLQKLGKSIGLTGKIRNKNESIKSYSQFGEDIIVYDLFRDLSIQNISYLDIGANNPQYISNTYLFYEKGFRGVLIEPNSALCEKLKTARPLDTVLNIGIGIDENIKEADVVGMGGTRFKIERVVKMPLLNVNHVIANYFTECPDFISIDVEGWDLKILKTFDFEKYSPAVFCVETLAYKEDGSTYRLQEINDFFESKGYFSYRETYANNIFVNKNLYDFYLYQKSNNKKEQIA